MQGRLQGPQVRVQELLIVNVCERIEAEATSLSFFVLRLDVVLCKSLQLFR
jgi:hypothetical protein